MSIPKRHHYVPRVHIRKFKTTNGYNLLLNAEKKIKNPQSSADFFVKKELNTIGNNEGDKDHVSFENELTIRWDNKFNKFCNILVSHKMNPERIDNSTLLFFFEYSIIALMRRLKMESKFNENFLSIKDVIPYFKEAFEPGLFDLRQFPKETIEAVKKEFQAYFFELEKLEAQQRQVKFPALIPLEAKMILPELCHCNLFLTKQDSFILPDCTITALKSEETFVWEGHEFNKIAMVGIPLTPKIYVELWNSDIVESKKNKLVSPTREEITHINQNLFNASYSQVLLSNPNQMEMLFDA